MNRTPHGHGGFYSCSGCQRGLTADQVAAYENCQRGFQCHKEGYGPTESLLSGEYHSLSPSLGMVLQTRIFPLFEKSCLC